VSAPVEILAPRVDAVRTALAVLEGIGFTFGVGEEPFVDIGDDSILANIVRSGACLSARHDSGAVLDLMLSGVGLSWPDLIADAAAFRLGDVEIRV
jgi:hypothetical protein